MHTIGFDLASLSEVSGSLESGVVLGQREAFYHFGKVTCLSHIIPGRAGAKMSKDTKKTQ